MLKRQVWAVLGLCAALSACVQSDVVDSADTGVGFGDYETYLAQREARAAQQAAERAAREAELAAERAAREAELARPARAAPEATGAPVATLAPAPGIATSDLAAAGIGAAPAAAAPAAPIAAPLAAPGMAAASAAGAPAGLAPAGPILPAAAQPGAAPQPVLPPPAQVAQAPVAQVPVAQVPVAGASGANVVAYALATTHAVGQPLYSRTLPSENRAERACRRYPGADLAQRAFLEAGGPERDRMGMDPDGDGFVCGWNPVPFRAARG